MQYILTEEEMSALRAGIEQERLKVREALQKACTMAADHTPIVVSWAQDKTPRPWGCVLSRPSPTGYCDECPVKDICPYERKRWSK
jgi:hypothetical protein